MARARYNTMCIRHTFSNGRWQFMIFEVLAIDIRQKRANRNRNTHDGNSTTASPEKKHNKTFFSFFFFLLPMYFNPKQSSWSFFLSTFFAADTKFHFTACSCSPSILSLSNICARRTWEKWMKKRMKTENISSLSV